MEEALFVLGILLMLSFPVMAIAGFVVARGAAKSSRDNTDQIHRIEQALNLIARRVDGVDARLKAMERHGGTAAEAAPSGATAAAPMLDERGVPIAPEHGPETVEPGLAPVEDGDVPAPEALGTPSEPGDGTPTPEALEAERRRRAAADLEAAGRRRAEAGAGSGPAAPAAPAKPARSLEEMLGTRWTVWVGGLALALGGVFLVRYSIEQGYFGPAARLVFATLFSALLLAGGEFLRRNEIKQAFAGLPVAHIPGVLTAAGTVAAFATVYGAHALYGFIGPAVAFVALGVVGVATMGLAVLHGPWLAVLGVLGAYATPVLVKSDAPNLPALVLFLLAVTASAFGIARLRLWRWVAASALVAAFLWGFPILDILTRPDDRTIWYVAYVVGLLALVAGILVVSIHGTSAVPEDRPTDRFAVTALSLVAALAFFAQIQDDHGLASRLLAGVTALSLLGLAWRVPAVAPASLTAGLFAALSVFFWQVQVNPSFWNDTFAVGADGLVKLRPRVIVDFLTVTAAGGALFLAAGFLGAARATPVADRSAMWFGLTGTIVPVLILVTTWMRVSAFEPSFFYAALGLGLAAAFGSATARLIGQERPDRPAHAVAVYAVGTVLALGTGLAIGLERGALTVAVAMMVPALAWVHRERPIPALRPLAGIVGLVVLARVLWDPRIVGDELGTTPIFNWILYGYGIPAFGFAFAAWTFRRSGDDAWQRLLEALAVIFAGLLALFEIRHLAHDGDVFAPTSSLSEIGMYATVGFLMSAGLTRLAGRLGSRVYDSAAMVLTGLGVIVAAAGLGALHNPMVTGDSVGEALILNALFFGYLLPALAAAFAARLARPPVRPVAFYRMLAGTALVLGFAWATLMVRRVYHGPVLAYGPTTDAELWSYSAVWLVFGLGLLIGGLLMASQPARLASAAIIVLTILKVFLIDMSELTGLWRALSFIGLGGVLVGIGMLYQRLLFPPRQEPAAPGPAPEA